MGDISGGVAGGVAAEAAGVAAAGKHFRRRDRYQLSRHPRTKILLQVPGI